MLFILISQNINLHFLRLIFISREKNMRGEIQNNNYNDKNSSPVPRVEYRETNWIKTSKVK